MLSAGAHLTMTVHSCLHIIDQHESAKPAAPHPFTLVSYHRSLHTASQDVPKLPFQLLVLHSCIVHGSWVFRHIMAFVEVAASEQWCGCFASGYRFHWGRSDGYALLARGKIALL